MARWSYGTQVIVLCMVSFLATMVARVVISPVVPDLTVAFDASTGAIGLALTGMWAAYALAQLPSGVLADRVGERRIVLVGVSGTGVVSLLLALSPGFVAFFVLVVVLGGVAGLVYSAAASLVTKAADQTGRAIGLFLLGGPVAGLVAPPLAASVAEVGGFRAALALGGVVALPAALAVYTGVRPTRPAVSGGSLSSQINVSVARELLSRPVIVSTTLLAFLGAFVWQATASFLPAFLEEHHGFSRGMASVLFSLYFVVHGAAQMGTGWYSDWASRDAAALLTMGTGVVAYGLFVVVSSPVGIVAAVVLAGLAMSWGAPLQSQFMDHLSDEEQGTGFGLVRTVYMTLGSLGSVVTGVIVDVAGWRPAFAVLVGCLVVASAWLVARRVRL